MSLSSENMHNTAGFFEVRVVQHYSLYYTINELIAKAFVCLVIAIIFIINKRSFISYFQMHLNVILFNINGI